MHGGFPGARDLAPVQSVTVASREELKALERWRTAFAGERKDHRFYELVEDTIAGFEYRYFIVRNAAGEVIAIQPFFILDQDLLGGTPAVVQRVAALARRFWPRFMTMRTLMMGCAAGEGHLDGSHPDSADALAGSITGLARGLGVSLIVLKEFPARYRDVLKCFWTRGFTRVPSMPMTKLEIGWSNFEDYLDRHIGARTRGKLRRKLRKAERALPPIEMSVVSDVTQVIDEIYPLYLDVYERSSLRFEKLTKEFLVEVGKQMSDRARFFVWRQGGKIIAFSLCLVEGRGIWSEYVGFDYRVAYDLNLYYVVFRDVLEWAIANRYTLFRSSALNYDPKYHLRQSLDPLDLYVRHTSDTLNAILKRVLPLMGPTRYDRSLPLFPNYSELKG